MSKPTLLLDMDGPAKPRKLPGPHRLSACTRCGVFLLGKRSFCHQCREVRRKEVGTAHYLANREKILERVKARNKETRKDERARYHAKYRTRKMARSYGISVDKMEALLALKECAVCHAQDRQMVTDHDHSTGFVRGRLCQNCNRGIGLLGDSATILQSAIDYLEGRR